MQKREFFKVEGDKIVRIRRHCPKCGPSVFLAEHKDRFSCGKCSYTEFKGGVKPPRPPKVYTKPVEKPKEAKPKEESKEEKPKEQAAKKAPPKEENKGKK